jgi:hypothetical protein
MVLGPGWSQRYPRPVEHIAGSLTENPGRLGLDVLRVEDVNLPAPRVSALREPAAQVRHVGFLGDRYEITTIFGPLTAPGSFGGDYALDQRGAPVASMVRQFSLREKFAIDIADGQNDALVLAVMLAVEAIHDRRRRRRSM